MSFDGMPRFQDGNGHSVPITGSWCPVCGYPRHPDLGPVHPTCSVPRTDTPG